MSYSTLYHKVVMQINPIQPRSPTPWCDSLLRAKSQTIFGAKRWESKELRASKSSDEPLDSSRQCRHQDPSSLLIPAIMTVERARVNLKASPCRAKLSECGSASSTHSGSSLRWCRKSNKSTRKKKREPDEIKRDDSIRAEDAVVVDVDRTESLPSDTSETSYSLRLDLRSSVRSYNPSSLRTSEIPGSPTVGMTYRCHTVDKERRQALTKKKPRRLDMSNMEAYRLSLAERAVEELLRAVTLIEAAQARERECIDGAAQRDAAAERHRKANDEFVRCWLVERGTMLGTMEAARFGELWDAMKRRKNNVHSRWISYSAWLGEKRDKTREKRAKEEAKRREKEEAEQVRREKAQQAYDKWRAVAMTRPAMPQLVVYTTEQGTRKYIRRGSFCNPNPWVDILEDERQKQCLAEQQLMESRKPSVRRPMPCPPPSRGGGARTVTAMFPMSETRLRRDGEAKRPKQSTYDNVVEFYTDLLRRCGGGVRRREGGEVPVHGRTTSHSHRTSRTSLPIRALETGHIPVYPRIPALVPVHAQGQIYAYGNQSAHAEQVYAHAPVHALRNVQAHTPVQAQGQVDSHGLVYMHMPPYAYVPVHSQMPFWQVEAQSYGHGPVQTLEPIHSPVSVHYPQQAQSFEPVNAYVPVHSPGQIYASEKVHAIRQVHSTEPIQSPGQGDTPRQLYGYAPVHSREPLHAHTSVQTPEQVRSLDTVHVPGPENTRMPLHAHGAANGLTPFHTPRPEDARKQLYAHVPVHSPGPARRLEPVHGRPMSKTQAPHVSLTTRTPRSTVQVIPPPTEQLRV